MNPFLQYFRIIFYSAFLALPVATFLYFLVKKGILKLDEERQKRMIPFLKKIILFSLIVIPSYLIIKIVFPNFNKRRIYNSEKQFMKAVLLNYENNKLPDSLKSEFINKSFHYLVNRHGQNIYYDNFRLDKYDSIELSFNIYFVENPNTSDSLKIDLRNKIRTTQDINKYLRNK